MPSHQISSVVLCLPYLFTGIILKIYDILLLCYVGFSNFQLLFKKKEKKEKLKCNFYFFNTYATPYPKPKVIITPIIRATICSGWLSGLLANA